MNSRRLIQRLCVASATALSLIAAHAAADVRFFTGPVGSTQHQVASELVGQVAPLVDMPIEIVPAMGPTNILQQLRDAAATGGRMNLALLPADLGPSYLFAAERNSSAADWLAPLQVIAPLYGEELHFIVRADSGLETMANLRNARINVGPLTGGTALSVITLYRLLFDVAPAPEKISHLSHEQALTKMLKDRSIDVVAVLGDQPVPLLAAMKPEARRFIRLLRFDPELASSASVLRVYGTSVLRSSVYPNVLAEDQLTLAVRVYLVAHGTRTEEDEARLRRLADAYCQTLTQLKSAGHPKWQELDRGLPPLAAGWRYATSSTPELARCLVLTDAIPDSCLPQKQALGLCKANAAAEPTAAGDVAPQ
jgi:TRAP-type uncharacterized transport system substrate-binding protein